MRRVPPSGTAEGTVYVDRDLLIGQQGSIPTAEFFNAMVGEMAAAIESGGLVPDSADNTQLAQVLQRLQTAQRFRPDADLIIYCAPSGSDTGGDGTEANPFRQPQKAMEYLAGSVDPAGRTVRIRLADGVYESVSLGAIAGQAPSNAVNAFYATCPVLEGNGGNPSAVVIDGSTNTTHGIGILGRRGCFWRVVGVTTRGSSYGVSVQGGVLHLESCRFDAAPWALVSATELGVIYLFGGTIVAGSEAALQAASGGRIYGGSVACTIAVQNNPNFSRAFLVALMASSAIDLAAVTFSGSATGRRHYTENCCTCYVAGKTAPGDQAGSTGLYAFVG